MEDRVFASPISVIRAFLTAAEFKNFTRTAEAMGMSQPSLSRILGGLENELGVRLFVRSRRGVELTEAGTYFRAQAAGVVTQVDGLVSELRLRARSPGGRIAIGLPIVMTELITEPLAAWFLGKFPRAQLSIQEGISDELEFETSLGRLDVAVLISADTRARNLETMPLASEQVYLHAAYGTKLSVDRPVTWQAVAGLPLILPRQSNFLRRRIEEASRRHHFSLNVVMEVNTPSSILSLVERGVGYTVLPGSASYRQRQHKLVSASPLRDFKVVWTMVRNRNPAQPTLVLAAEKKIRELIRSQSKSGLWHPVA